MLYMRSYPETDEKQIVLRAFRNDSEDSDALGIDIFVDAYGHKFNDEKEFEDYVSTLIDVTSIYLTKGTKPPTEED